MVQEMSCRAQPSVVPTGAELEDEKRGVGVVDADALSALVRVLHHAARAVSRGLVVALPRVKKDLRGGG